MKKTILVIDDDSNVRNIPIIVISGLSGHECAVVNAAESISKPFDRNQLLAVVKETLNLS